MFRTVFSILVIGYLGLVACESNPVGGGTDIAAPRRRLLGEVRLDARMMPPAGVYVWLEGFNLGQKTAADGRFEFVLPPPLAQSGGRGVSGAFNIYYFMANFRLAVTPVQVINGDLVYSTDQIDADGELRIPKTLSQRLRIGTSMQPYSVRNSDINVTAGKTDFLLRVDVTLQAVRDSVIVFFPRKVGPTISPLLFRNVATNETKIFGSAIAGFVASDIDTIDSVPVVRTLVVPIFPDDLEPGEYEIIPYLLIQDQQVPEALIESLGIDVLILGESYINLPMLRQADPLTFRVEP